MTVSIPPGYDALRQCVLQMVPSLASGDLGTNPFVTTGSTIYGSWAPHDTSSDAAVLGALHAFNQFVNYIPEVDYVYRPKARTITQAYSLILDNLSFVSAGPTGDDPSIDALYDQQSSLSDDVSSLWDQMNQEYAASAFYPMTPFSSFLTRSRYFQRFVLKKQQLGNVTLELRRKIGPGGAIQSALDDYNATVNPATVPNPIDPWTWGGLDLPAKINAWRQGQELNTIEVAAGSATTSSSTSQFIDGKGGGTGYFTDLFATWDTGSSGSTTSINKTSDKVTISMMVKAWVNVPVVINDPGNRMWFDESLLQSYATDQSFGKPYTGARTGANPVYGPNGILPWRISSVILAYQPQVKITLSSSSYSELDQTRTTNKTWSVGPFGIFGGRSKTSTSKTQSITTDDSAQCITITDNSQDPVILAMSMENVP
jgi:hypothetical protein